MGKKAWISITILIIGVIISFRFLNKSKNANTILENNISDVQAEIKENVINREQLEEFNAKLDNGVHVNTSGEMQTVKNYKGLELNNVNLETLGSRTVMLADVKNTTKKIVKERTIKVDLLSKEGKTVVTLTGTLETVEPGEIVQLNLEIEGDYTNVYDYKIYE